VADAQQMRSVSLFYDDTEALVPRAVQWRLAPARGGFNDTRWTYFRNIKYIDRKYYVLRGNKFRIDLNCERERARARVYTPIGHSDCDLRLLSRKRFTVYMHK